jgi:hypothetical protein
MVLNLAGDMASSRAAQILTFVAAFLVSLMANGALFRLAFADQHPGDPEFKPGPQGLQFAGTEARLLGAVLLVGLFVALAVLFLLLIVVIFAIAAVVTVHGEVDPTTAIKQPDVQALLSLLLLVFVAVMLWAAVRIGLYPAATVAEKKVQVFSTWRLTAGNGWRIFAAMLITVSPALIMQGLVNAASGTPTLLAGFAILSAAVNAFIELPLFCGLYASLYRRLHGAASTLAIPAAADASTGLAGPWG